MQNGSTYIFGSTYLLNMVPLGPDFFRHLCILSISSNYWSLSSEVSPRPVQYSHKTVLGSVLGILELIKLIMSVIENRLSTEILMQGLIPSGTLFIAHLVDERIFVLRVSYEVIILASMVLLFLFFVIYALLCTVLPTLVESRLIIMVLSKTAQWSMF